MRVLLPTVMLLLPLTLAPFAASTSLVVSIDAPLEGASVEGTLLVMGTASHPSRPIDRVAYEVYRGGGLVMAGATDLSGPAGAVRWEATVPTALLPNGEHTLQVRASAGGDLAATDAASFRVANEPRIDVAALHVGQSPFSTATTTRVSYGVKNLGNVESGDFTVRVEYRYNGAWRLIRDDPIRSLAPGESTSVDLPWTPQTPHVGSFLVRATADPSGALADVDRSNNARNGTAFFGSPLVPGEDLGDPTVPPGGDCGALCAFGPWFGSIGQQVNHTMHVVKTALAGQPGQAVVNTTQSFVCGPPNSSQNHGPACRAVSGRPVTAGAFDLCAEKAPPNGPAYAPYWYVLHGGEYRFLFVSIVFPIGVEPTLAATTRTAFAGTALEGESLCHDHWDTLRALATLP